MGLLENKICLITGGSRGIGEAIVRRFHSEGAQIVFTYRSSSEKADALVADLGSRVEALQSDASDFEAAGKLITDVIGKYERIDVLINNAGITDDTLMLRMSEDQWDRVIDINLKSVFNLTKQIMPASKAGIIGFSKSIAKEIGSRGIRCNAIAPGFIETDMTDELDDKTKQAYIDNIPIKRLGTGQDVADGCVFLGSDMSKYITGQVISICGGLNT